MKHLDNNKGDSKTPITSCHNVEAIVVGGSEGTA
jgi:hypothetical protein